MRQCIEIGSACAISYPQSLLTCGLEAGIVAFAFGAQRVDALELQAVTVNGKAVGVRDRFVLGTASVLLAVVPVWVVTGALSGFGLTERAAEFLSKAAVTV